MIDVRRKRGEKTDVRRRGRGREDRCDRRVRTDVKREGRDKQDGLVEESDSKYVHTTYVCTCRSGDGSLDAPSLLSAPSP